MPTRDIDMIEGLVPAARLASAVRLVRPEGRAHVS